MCVFIYVYKRCICSYQGCDSRVVLIECVITPRCAQSISIILICTGLLFVAMVKRFSRVFVSKITLKLLSGFQ